jgi:hypothetical protein
MSEVLRILCPRATSNKELWKTAGQVDVNSEIRKRKFGWIGHTLIKDDAEIPKATLQWKQKQRKTKK